VVIPFSAEAESFSSARGAHPDTAIKSSVKMQPVTNTLTNVLQTITSAVVTLTKFV
jgi:hypothetical protein